MDYLLIQWLKIHLFVCFGSMKLLNLVINLTQYELNRTDNQLITYINIKFKSSKYESNISKTQNLITKWKTKELF